MEDGFSEECGLTASAINGRCCRYNKWGKGKGRTQNCKIGCKVVDSSMVPGWYAGTSHRLQTGVWHPVGMQGCHTGCKQEYSTQLVHRNVTQVVSK